MNINRFNYFSSNNSSFKGKNIKKMAESEKFDIYAKNVAKILAQKAELEVPENGKFSPCAVSFDIPGMPNITGFYGVCHDEKEYKNLRRFFISVKKNNRDELTTNYLSKGTKKEILEFLNHDNNAELFKKTLRELSQFAEEKFS